MSSIYQDFISFSQFCEMNQEKMSLISASERDNLHPMLRTSKALDIAKLFLTNGKQACIALQKGSLTKLDPIVGENACQIRASAAIEAYINPTFQEEVKSAQQGIEKLLLALQKYQNKPPVLGSELSFIEILERLNLSFTVSEKMSYLFRSHLLTVGKIFEITREGNETSCIDCQVLLMRLSKQLDRRLVEEIVHIAREKIAKQSILFIQSESHLLAQEQAEHCLVKEQLKEKCIQQIRTALQSKAPFTFDSSCVFYNFKTILLRACIQNIPLLIKEYRTDKQTPFGLYYHSPGSQLTPVLMDETQQKQMNPKQAVFVIECFFNKEKTKEEIASLIHEQGLLEVALANAAVLPQFSAHDNVSLLDQEAIEEIHAYRKLGQTLNCQHSSPAIFSIAHTHAATVQEEKVK